MMYLASYLNPQDIIVESRVLSKEQVYQDLVNRICRNHDLPICGKPLMDMIMQRDQEAPTAYKTGIAIPHIRMEGFQDTVVAMAFLQNPLVINATKVHWVVLIITDKSSSKIYLNMVSALLKLSRDEAAMAKLTSATDGHLVLHHLKEMNVEIKKEIFISDIMSTDPISTTPESTLLELNNLMKQHNIAGMPVVDELGNYIGEVNIFHVLKVGIPDYMMMLENLSFLVSSEPLENLLNRQSEIKTKEIMEKDSPFLRPEASIIEAVFDMISHKRRYMSVVKDGKLLGLVSAMDILRKVITA